MKNNKTILLSLVGVALLIVSVTGISIAFFNYTRTGAASTFSVGRIFFNSTQEGRINLTNIFPVGSNQVVPNANNTVVVNVYGDTEYTGGIEYLVTVDNLNNTINNKEIPIAVSVDVEANSEVTGSVIGTEDDSYFTNRGGNTSRYKVLANGDIAEDQQLVAGYIAPGQTGVNGNITITGYVDGDKVTLSDSLEGGDVAVTGYVNGTNDNWVDGRTVLTTSEWNALSNSGVSFQVKVEANEGIWVEEPSFTINFNPNGGVVGINSKSLSPSASTYGELPIAKRVDYIFNGWYTGPNNGTIVTENTIFNDNSSTNLYAHWNAVPSTPEEMCPNCVYTYIDYYNDGLKYTKNNTKNMAPSIIDNYEDDYVELYDKVGSSIFLGLVLDENTNDVEKAYTCALKNGENFDQDHYDSTLYCIEGGTNANYYRNLGIVNSSELCGDVHSVLIWNSCSIEINNQDWNVSTMDFVFSEDGYAETTVSGFGCWITRYGEFYCG